MKFPYDPTLIDEIKSRMEGRRWNPDVKEWTAPMSGESLELLKEWGFQLSTELLQWQSSRELSNVELPELNLNKQLYPFQEDGIRFIESRKGRVLLAYDMGLGKTATTIAWLQWHRELRPVIVICPSTIKWNWRLEWQKWTGKQSIQILSGRTPYGIDSDIIIINYDILKDWVGVLRAISPRVVVADESHMCRDPQALRTKAFKRLTHGVPHVLALTGTPVVNRPIEIFPTLQILDSTRWGSRFRYAQDYCAARHNGFGWDFSGTSNSKKLHSVLTESVMLRRTKAEVLKDLPDKTYSTVPLEVDNRQEYEDVRDGTVNWIKSADGHERNYRMEALAKIEALKQVAVRGKMKQCVEWISEFLDSGEKLVVFCLHRFVIDELMRQFKDMAVRVDGSVVGEQRQWAVDRFQSDPDCRVFVGQIKAAGVGITLTAASNVVFIEYPWSPSDAEQCADRCHRIGQKNSVTVWNLVAVDTIEESIIKLLASKQQVVDAVVEGKVSEELNVFQELLKEVRLSCSVRIRGEDKR